VLALTCLGAFAGSTEANGRAKTAPMHLRSVRALPSNLFEPQLAFDGDGRTLWLVRLEDELPDGRHPRDRHLRLSSRNPEGRIVHEASAPLLSLRQPPTGIAPTATGMVVYGDSPGKDGWFAYAQFFDRQGVPGELRIYRGAVGIRAVAGSADGGLAMLMQVYDKATIHGVPITGPSSNGNQPPSSLVLRLKATGSLEWLRILDDQQAARDPWIVGAGDGRLALLLGERSFVPGASGPSWSGGGIAIWSREGKMTWLAEKLATVTGAAFDGQGALWAIGMATLTGPPPKILPAQDVPQVLDSYGPELLRQVICEKGCMRMPQLAADGEGNVVLLAAVTAPCSFDGKILPVDRTLAESWVVLQINQHRLRASHTLKTTRARLAVGSHGRIAILASGVRGTTILDDRVVGKMGETLLIQFDP
jgi:hypothetical protein